jgi:hypothetical protein
MITKFIDLVNLQLEIKKFNFKVYIMPYFSLFTPKSMLSSPNDSITSQGDLWTNTVDAVKSLRHTKLERDGTPGSASIPCKPEAAQTPNAAPCVTMIDLNSSRRASCRPRPLQPQRKRRASRDWPVAC